MWFDKFDASWDCEPNWDYEPSCIVVHNGNLPLLRLTWREAKALAAKLKLLADEAKRREERLQSA